MTYQEAVAFGAAGISTYWGLSLPAGNSLMS